MSEQSKKILGIVGGGQLGRMLASEAQKLGFRVIVLDPTPNSPAAQIADEHILGDFKDPAAIHALADKVDFLTFEIESANAEALKELGATGRIPVHPSPKVLEIIKDKFAQKTFLRERGIPIADFRETTTSEDIERTAAALGYPFLLKSRFGGYDGRGNAVIEKAADIPLAQEKLGGQALYAEKFVPFAKELAVMVARGVAGEIVVYPVVETIQKNNICHVVIAPAQVNETIQRQAKQLALKVMENLEGVGVFGIEMFLTAGGEVLVNEIAPRVHNSGHYTLEACAVSQFKQHILAVAGLPLEEAGMHVPAAVMLNVLGDRSGEAHLEGVAEAQTVPNTTVYWYGKIEARPERKMGHITATAETVEEALVRVHQARSHLRF